MGILTKLFSRKNNDAPALPSGAFGAWLAFAGRPEMTKKARAIGSIGKNEWLAVWNGCLCVVDAQRHARWTVEQETGRAWGLEEVLRWDPELSALIGSEDQCARQMARAEIGACKTLVEQIRVVNQIKTRLSS